MAHESAGIEAEARQPEPSPPASLSAKVANSAMNLLVQFASTTVLSGISTVVITRLLGPSGYGVYGAAIAVFTVLGAFADFGFSTMLSRDMAADTSRHASLLRTAYEVALGWSFVLAVAMVGLAIAAGPTTQRGLALLILSPSMVFNGLNPARSFFYVTYRTSLLVRVDVACLLVQTVVTITLAAFGLGPVAVVASVSVGNIVASLATAAVAARFVGPIEDRVSRRELIVRSLPLGLISVMVRVYLSIDLILLGWYIRGPELGDYAAASKLLALLATIAGLVMTSALPALAQHERLLGELNHLVERVWHWLMMTAIPIFVGVALFAPLFIKLALGDAYQGAVPLTRILCIAGAVTVASNVAGNVMIAQRRSRQLVLQNGAAIVLNVVGNVIFIPHYGAYASAWITGGTECLVCGLSIATLRHQIDFRPLLRVSWRPAVGMGVATAVALPLLDHQVLGLLASGSVFLIVLTLLRAWPEELPLGRLRRLVV
jgi:O-antigen/teichoic acid export membrane protein